jgi:1,4-dihydroxy-6-naphthoate synthase
MKLTLGFSPCPNDTFIFDALVNGKIDTQGLAFEVYIEDVETLNALAMQGKLDITKISYHAYAYVSETYLLLHAGSALGRGCGPLLIAKDNIPEHHIPHCVIGIPGRFTTANLLLGIAYPQAITKKEMLFSEIENQLLDDKIDAGVIIHENRFTYKDKGLRLITDLGAYWETRFSAPIPLGAIAVKRMLDPDLQRTINNLMQQSVVYANTHPLDAKDFVRQYASEMDANVMQQHIALYVNAFTETLGEEGKHAVEKLFDIAMLHKIIPGIHHPFFVQ